MGECSDSAAGRQVRAFVAYANSERDCVGHSGLQRMAVHPPQGGGWIIGGLSVRRRAMALAGAIGNFAFMAWWYSTVAQIPASQAADYVARELPVIAIGIGGMVVGYRLWQGKRRDS